MKKVTRNEADFSELFRFAEEKFGIGWNDCCDLFHRSEFIRWRNITELYLDDLEEHKNVEITSDRSNLDTKYDWASKIAYEFMLHHDVKECTIISD
jgi:hypothetical protein